MRRRILGRLAVESTKSQDADCYDAIRESRCIRGISPDSPSCDIFNFGFIIFQCPLTTVHHLYIEHLLSPAENAW